MILTKEQFRYGIPLNVTRQDRYPSGSRAVFLGLLLCVPLFCGQHSLAQNSKPTAVSPQIPKAAPPSEFKVPLLTEPLRLSDFQGMEPDSAIKDKLAKVTGFVQNTPNDGESATQQTDVWIAHTSSTLYFVFICHDDHPGLIRSHLARREDISGDDNVSVLLDPFQDRRKGVLFSVNPIGVQADAAWTDNPSADYSNDPDYSYDQVWDSEARITATGWMAMIAIPFRSLRFRNAASDWGVVFMRNLPRNSEIDFWPRVSTSISGVLSQEATMHGIEGVTGSHNLQINPYVLAQNERELINLDPLNPYFSSEALKARPAAKPNSSSKTALFSMGPSIPISATWSRISRSSPSTSATRYTFPNSVPSFLRMPTTSARRSCSFTRATSCIRNMAFG